MTDLLKCAADCGVPLHRAAAAGGHDRHPGCTPEAVSSQVTRWICMQCGAEYVCDNATHGIALSRVHDAYSCPMPPWRLGEDEIIVRVRWRANLTRLFPGEMPPVTTRRVGDRLIAVLA